MQYLYDFIKNYITESRIELVELAKQREGLNKEAGGKCGWFATADSFINFLHSPAGKKMAKKYSEDLIRYIYILKLQIRPILMDSNGILAL